jgi:tRNA A-37 threonylcarbamoyl transferase component Bud32
MTADRWRQIQEVFQQAIEVPEEERTAFLDGVCRGDDDLRRELDSLLLCDTPGQLLVDLPCARGAREGSGAPEYELTGQRIGPYRIARLIGHGGMGSVYLGSRDDQHYRKQVAIKLLKRGMDTDFMLSRFRQERQILANLEHPYIARLLDGGATHDALPYFVMEYVDGVPLTNFCIEKDLSIPERLRLFCLVCEAVQHAHQNLVVHRDIKPGNILTTKEGVPKLLDFGIAKVIDYDRATTLTLTQPGLRLLTPDYASPEHVRGAPITTASDIYSLGAVLYEMLSGVRPHRFPFASVADLEKAICTTDPEKPSLAAGQNSGLPPNVRKQRKRQVSGDLDKIVLTAMSRDPRRRYASAAELSADLVRHLEGLPVTAREDRLAYRAGKFIRRHHTGIAALLLVMASLVGGTLATTVQARRAERRFQLVRGLANSMLFELHDEMAKLPGSTALQASAIRTVVSYLDRLAEDASRDDQLDLEIAMAYERAGTLEGHPFRSNLGHGGAALTNYRKALVIYERLANRPSVRTQAIRGLVDTKGLRDRRRSIRSRRPRDSSRHPDQRLFPARRCGVPARGR